MKRIKKVFFCRQNGKRCFSCEERVVYDIDLISNKVKEKIRKIREKRGKIRKTWSMTKKRSSEIFAAKMKIFSEKRHPGRRKNFLFPQTRRQVSATGPYIKKKVRNVFKNFTAQWSASIECSQCETESDPSPSLKIEMKC